MSTKRVFQMMLVASVVLAVGVGTGPAGTARALPVVQQPGPGGVTIPYSGRLTDDAGQPVADGAYDFTFALYEAAEGGDPLWSETQTGVPVQGGAFTAALGSVSPLPDGAQEGGLWLEVGVRGPGEAEFTLLSPRQALSAAALLAPASPSAGPACAHDHVGEMWVGAGEWVLLAHNTFTHSIGILGGGFVGVEGISPTWIGVVGDSTNGIGVVGNSEHGIGVKGVGATAGVSGTATTASGFGVYGDSTDGIGVVGRSADGIGVVGRSADGTGVWGESTNWRGVLGQGGWRGVEGISPSGRGVYGYSSNGTGVYGESAYGTAIQAAGTGIISSTADSVLYLSPHSMVNRGSANVTLIPGDNGSMLIQGTGGTEDKYLSIPVSTFGSLFGTPVYVKAVEVCYSTGTSGRISATTVTKNVGTGYTYYIYEAANRSSASRTCYTLNAAKPRQAIDSSTWVQFNVAFSNLTAPTVTIYSVALTLTEQQN